MPNVDLKPERQWVESRRTLRDHQLGRVPGLLAPGVVDGPYPIRPRPWYRRHGLRARLVGLVLLLALLALWRGLTT